ncbi:hypothetical protein [Acidisoma silvae]|uniref:Flagellar FliJ protein n=1 Tax=Acidisoma silvae TaxID=2802396 RepID=A0A963YQ95_9PROT|nr:hypothetical protein [Acidisoma silvae]MCB8874924.1 hypothetical protein [Acidisoma silvae]
MKAPTITILQRLADIQSLAIAEEIARQNRIIGQASQQRQLLAAYRETLSRGWRSGQPVEAGTARRAVDFIVASVAADRQIDEMEQQAQQAMAAARMAALALQQRQDRLDDARQRDIRAADRAADIRRERAQPLVHNRRPA